MLKKLVEYIIHYSSGGPPCYVREINISKQEVVIRLKRRAIYITCKLADAISDEAIIGSLSSWDACWLGGHLGRALRASQEGRVAPKKAAKTPFLLRAKGGRYRVVFEDRSGMVGYVDTRTGQEFVEHPVTIATNDLIINRFNSSQACYIGILAGIRMERAVALDEKIGTSKATKILKEPPKLRVVD